MFEKYSNYLNKIKNERANALKLRDDIENLKNELKVDLDTLDVMSRAASLLTNVSDDNTNKLLDRIVSVINSCLSEMFPYDARKIEIKSEVFNKVYPHYEVVLTNSKGIQRSFDQSGTGIAQVISFLFSVCLIEAYGGRKLFIMDELLNGLHPDAKKIIKSMVEDVLTPEFQFVVVEYGVNIGTQFEVVKQGITATVNQLPESNYF